MDNMLKNNKKLIKGYNDFATLYPKMLVEWDYEKNDRLGLKPDEMLVGSQKKVNWICSKGHSFERSIYDRLNGRGHCPYCSNRKVLKGFNDLATTNPELLKEWNYDKNEKLGIRPDEITNGGKTKVWWKCKKGHEWQSTVSSRIRDKRLYHECPACMSYRKISLPEKIIYYYLKKAFSDTIASYKPLWLNNKEIDIYIPSKKVGIEYDGAYYHKDYERDLLKDELCKSNGVTLIRIREKNTPKIKSTSIIFKLLDNNKSDGSHVKSGIEFLEKYFRISLNYDLNRDIDEILELINFIEKYNCIANRNPEVLNEWDYDRNNELGITPNNVSAGSSIKVWWKCEKGHSYQREIYNQRNGYGKCPICKKNK